MYESRQWMADVGGSCRLEEGVGMRTEAVLLVALRAAAPAERAVRSADRANMLWVKLAPGGEGRGSMASWAVVIVLDVDDAGILRAWRT